MANAYILIHERDNGATSIVCVYNNIDAYREHINVYKKSLEKDGLTVNDIDISTGEEGFSYFDENGKYHKYAVVTETLNKKPIV